MRIIIVIMIGVLLAYMLYRLIKGVSLLLMEGTKSFYKDSVALYNDYEEEIKDKINYYINLSSLAVKSSTKAFKRSLPGKEKTTTGRKTIKQMLVRGLIILSLWVISLVVVMFTIASNFNFAMGMY